MTKQHAYPSRIVWTGNRGEGTQHYKGYDRTWDLAVPGKPVVSCSNDPVLGGNPALYNPEDLLISAVASCHMLWYLHLCSDAGVTVLAYEDNPVGDGVMHPDASGNFTGATLHPRITLAPGADQARARALHDEVHKYCFIARSVNFPISFAPEFIEG
jgi:organic hydroperoxide reductase OsmC/OhrA